MGWSKDPEKRARQEAALAAGRRIRDERRAAGLPPKRRRRVVESGYPDEQPKPKPSSRGEGRGTKPKKPRSVEGAREPERGGEPSRAVRILGRIMGIPH